MLNTEVLLKIDNTSALAWIKKGSASTGTEFKYGKIFGIFVLPEIHSFRNEIKWLILNQEIRKTT